MLRSMTRRVAELFAVRSFAARSLVASSFAIGTLALAETWLTGAAQAQSSVKIGYAVSRTGPNAGGVAVTTLPNYEMWVKEVNAAGGLRLGDKRVPIEVVQYDNRSSAEEPSMPSSG